jgi:DNA replication licensing factor MCM7
MLTIAIKFEKSFPEEQQTLKLVESIQKNTKRYIDVFSQAVDAMMPAGNKDISYVA